MSRNLLDVARIHPAIRDKVASFNSDIVREVEGAIAQHKVVVVGMKQNPFPRKARKLLDSLGIAYHYLEYGSYLSLWKRRLALKMWTGWSTFPMVFVRGELIGGYNELQAMADSGELKRLVA
jgi:monothiol glutaredoxin